MTSDSRDRKSSAVFHNQRCGSRKMNCPTDIYSQTEYFTRDGGAIAVVATHACDPANLDGSSMFDIEQKKLHEERGKQLNIRRFCLTSLKAT
jgi:hypothetical protein